MLMFPIPAPRSDAKYRRLPSGLNVRVSCHASEPITRPRSGSVAGSTGYRLRGRASALPVQSAMQSW